MVLLKIKEYKAGTTTTTDAATQQPLCTFNVSTAGPNGTALDNCSIFIIGRCTGYVTGAGTAVGAFDGAQFKVVSGTLSQVGASAHIVPPIKDTGGSPSADFSVAGSVITYFVTGVAATTIEWSGDIEILVYRPV